jgi:hypothetical protein
MEVLDSIDSPYPATRSEVTIIELSVTLTLGTDRQKIPPFMMAVQNIVNMSRSGMIHDHTKEIPHIVAASG